MSNVAILRFLVEFFRTFFELYVTFLAFFLYFMGLLGLLRCFVANKICRNLRIFLGKIILAHTLLV